MTAVLSDFTGGRRIRGHGPGTQEKECAMPKHRKRRPGNELRPENARPLAPEEFRQAVLRAEEAASKPHPLLHERVTPHVILQNGDKTTEITITDTPLARIIFALQECYPVREESLSAFWRFQAIGHLVQHQALSPWVRSVGPGAWEVQDPIFFVAATAPLDTKGKFLLKPFLAALTAWAEAHPERTQDDAPGATRDFPCQKDSG
jgi:hypothetical protein